MLCKQTALEAEAPALRADISKVIAAEVDGSLTEDDGSILSNDALYQSYWWFLLEVRKRKKASQRFRLYISYETGHLTIYAKI